MRHCTATTKHTTPPKATKDQTDHAGPHGATQNHTEPPNRNTTHPHTHTEREMLIEPHRTTQRDTPHLVMVDEDQESAA